MKTKSFLLFSTSVFAISIFLIVFHSQPPQSIQSIVTQTHQHIKDFQASLSQQESLRDVEENHLVAEEQYARLLGLDGRGERWHNTTTPALVTYARGDAHAQAVSFVRAAAKLPYTVLLYNLGLKPYSLSVVSVELLQLLEMCHHRPGPGRLPIACQRREHTCCTPAHNTARAEPRGRRGVLRGFAALDGHGGRAGGAVGARGSGRRRAGVAAACRRHVAYAPAHVPLLPRHNRRLPVRADDGRDAARARRQARRARHHASLDPVRAHARLHHAHRCTVGGLPLRQEAAVPLLGLPRAGRVGAEHRAGAALGLRGGDVRRAGPPRALAQRGRRRRARRAGGGAAQQLRAGLPHRARRARRAAHGARGRLSLAHRRRQLSHGARGPRDARLTIYII